MRYEHRFTMVMVLDEDSDADTILYRHLKRADFDFWTEGDVEIVQHEPED